MSLQIRRGPNQGVGGRTGVTLVQGEIAFVTDYATANVSPMWIGDGTTLGGIPVAPVLNVNGLTGAVNLTTTQIGEGSGGSNLYFTTTRAIDAVGTNLAGGILSGLTISYNSTTHTISITNTNVIQTGTANSLAYWAGNGTTLSPSSNLTWNETTNVLQNTNGTVYVTANNGLRATVIYDSYNTSGPNSLTFRRAHGTNITPTGVASNDGIHNIVWQAYDGYNFVNTSAISGSVQYGSTVAQNNVQGTLVFATTDSTQLSTAPLYNRMRIDNSGQVTIGPYLTTESGSGQVVIRQTVTSNGKSPFTIYNIYNDAYGSSFGLAKARGTYATPLAVGINDVLGAFNFRGYYGTNYASAASIRAYADLAPNASGYVPGALSFQVTNSTGILTEAMRINNDSSTVTSGNFTINGTLTVNGSTVTTNTTTINVEDKLMKLGYLSNSQVSTTGAVGSVKGLLLQGSTAFTSSGVSVTAAATYTSLSQTATSGSGVGAVFTVQKTGSAPNYCSTVTFASGTIGSIKGALVQASTTFTASGTSVTAASTYTGVSQTATSGTGTGAIFTIQKIGVGTAYNGAIVITITTAGTGYAIGDTITIPGASLGGATPANNLVLTVATALGSPWVATVSGLSGVGGLVIGGTINAAAGTGLLYGGSPTSCVVTTIGSTSITYTLTGGTTPVAGTITSLVQSSNLNITITSPGAGYAIGDTVTLAGASLGGATPANNLVLTVTTALGGPWTATITGMTDTVDLQVGSAITATGTGTSGTITATATTHATASCTAGSISGTTLTVSGTVSGTFAIGMAITGAGINAGTYIVSGSGSTWNLNISDVVSATLITGTTDLITVSSTSSLQLNTIITTPSAFGGLATSTTYYVNNIASATQFSVVLSAGGTTPVTLTTASGSVALTYLNGSLGSGGSYLVTNIISGTSVAYTATGGTIPVAGPVTNITTNGATDYTANGGGIQVYGATNKTFTWSSTNSSWTSSEGVALASGKKLTLTGSVSGAVSFVATGAVGTQNYTLPTALPASSGYALASDTSGNLSWIAVNSSTISGAQLTNGATVSGGSLTFSGNISAAAWTTSGIRHVSVPATLTDTTSTGVVTNAYTNSFGGNTIAATGTVTYTNYGTVFINNPSPGANVTITNPWSLITAGNVLLGGDLVGVATQNVFNTISTTVNAFGGATSALKIGGSTAPITGFAATATTSSTAASLGYVGMPQNTQSSAYPIVIGDAGKHIYASATMTATIPASGTVNFPIGTTIAFIAGAGATLTIAITTDKLYLGGAGTGGAGVSRTLAAYGMATAVKVASDTWFINGTGLT